LWKCSDIWEELQQTAVANSRSKQPQQTAVANSCSKQP